MQPTLDATKASRVRSATEVHHMMYNIYSSRIPIASMEESPELQPRHGIVVKPTRHMDKSINASLTNYPSSAHRMMLVEPRPREMHPEQYSVFNQHYPQEMLQPPTPDIIAVQPLVKDDYLRSDGKSTVGRCEITETGKIEGCANIDHGELHKKGQPINPPQNSCQPLLDMPIDLSLKTRRTESSVSPMSNQSETTSVVLDTPFVIPKKSESPDHHVSSSYKLHLTIKTEEEKDGNLQTRILIPHSPQSNRDCSDEIRNGSCSHEFDHETTAVNNPSSNRPDTPISYHDVCTSTSDLAVQRTQYHTKRPINKRTTATKTQANAETHVNLSTTIVEPPLHEDTLLMMVNHLPQIKRKGSIYVAVGDLREVLFPWCQTIKCSIFTELFYETILPNVDDSESENNPCILYLSAKDRHDFASQYQIMCLKSIMVRLDTVVSSLKAFYKVMWKTHQQVIRDTGKVPCRLRTTPLDMLENNKALAEVEACIRHVNAWYKPKTKLVKASTSESELSKQEGHFHSPDPLHLSGNCESFSEQTVEAMKQNDSLLFTKDCNEDANHKRPPDEVNSSNREASESKVKKNELINVCKEKIQAEDGRLQLDLEGSLQPTKNTKYFIRHFRSELLPICRGNKSRTTGNYVPLVTILTLFPFIKGQLDLSTATLLKKYPMLRMRKASRMEANMLTRLRSACRHIDKEGEKFIFILLALKMSKMTSKIAFSKFYQMKMLYEL